jgi:NADH-quinone oxidoreductase subunit L
MAISGRGKTLAHLPVWLGLGIASIVALSSVTSFNPAEPLAIIPGYTWLDVGNINIKMDLRLDCISLTQICVVTCISFLVALYSSGYMHGDSGYARFFAVFSGFVFSMSMLVLVNNLLMLYAFWEGVGLCSYLLIGYWYERPSAAKAAFKAFLVNRLADCGLLIGIITLAYAVGLTHTDSVFVIQNLNFDVIFKAVPQLSAEHPLLLTFIGFMLLIGAIGKSAQFPFHVWLPDAMEGPTPVSALIHAATMVTAGIYLLARMSPLLIETPIVLMTAGWLGSITALLGAVIALFQHDLKRMLAYSTVSQLGYMFIAIGAGAQQEAMLFGVAAAMFHLLTHAFFKALLFLTAGNIMHAMGDVIDMRRFSGLRHVLPKSHILFLIGALALAGVPPLAGFWSKDGILAVLATHIDNTSHSGGFVSWFGIGLLTALITSIYTFRAYFRVFYGHTHTPEEAGAHPHDASFSMFVPLWILAAGSILAGWLLGPTAILTKFITENTVLPHPEAHAHDEFTLMVLSAMISLTGITIAWFTTSRATETSPNTQNIEDFESRGFAKLAGNRFYLDEYFAAFLVTPLFYFSKFLALWDLLVMDGIWRIFSFIPYILGGILQTRQNGLLPKYGMGMTLGIIILLVIVLKW